MVITWKLDPSLDAAYLSVQSPTCPSSVESERNIMGILDRRDIPFGPSLLCLMLLVVPLRRRRQKLQNVGGFLLCYVDYSVANVERFIGDNILTF